MREVFDPARQDLRIAHLERLVRTRSPLARAWSHVRYAFGVAILVVDCWRLPSVDPVDRQPPERAAMFAFYVRHAFRLLARERAFTAAAVLTLALGVGANAAVFAVVEAVLLRPLPYPDAGAVVTLNHRDLRTGVTKEFIAMGDYVDLAARQDAFAAFGAYGGRQATVVGLGEPFRVAALLATSGVCDALGLEPVLGRCFEPADSRAGAQKIAVIGYQLWQQRFASDPLVVGRSITLGSDRYQIVGVAPQGFHFPPQAPTDLILPMAIPAQAPTERKSGWVFAVARLKPGTPINAAQAQLATLSKRFASEFPRENEGSQYFAVPLRDALVGSSKGALMLLFGAVALVLLIACANVANLLLARALSRSREMAVRLALGANRGHVTAQLLAESLALALVAAVAGVALAEWGAPALVALVPRAVVVPGLADVHLNGAVLAFTLAISIATALVFGMISALMVGADSTAGALVAPTRTTASRSSRRVASALVVVEVAIAVVLLMAAGLVVRSFVNLATVDPGFQMDHVMTVTSVVPADRYRDAGSRAAFYQRAVNAIQSVGGVRVAGHAQVVPLTGNNWTAPFERVDRPASAGERPPDVGWQSASSGYFAALRIPLLSGRLFDDRDRPGTPRVIIVSQAIEARYFPGESAVGRRVKIGAETAEIVGVVGNIRRAALSDEPRADLYDSSEQDPSAVATWFIRTDGDPASVLPDVQAALRRIEPSTVFVAPRTLAAIAGESLQVVHLALWLFGVFAAIALALSAVGAYGVMSYVVRQRTREIGTRVALGATKGDVLWLVLRQGAGIAAGGTALGVSAGMVAARSLGTLLYGVTAWDPLSLTIAATVLVATIMSACYLPARRAAMIDPARTLAEI